MSAVSLPVTRPVGRVLIVAHAQGRASLVEMLARLGFDSGECEDPYTATLELTRRRLAYRALILSLASLYREELTVISTVKRRYPHLEIWLTHTDGRQAALAEAMRLGADGLFDQDGLHRIAAPPQEHALAYQPLSAISPAASFGESNLEETSADSADIDSGESSPNIHEPVLSADELRALLQEQPIMPPSGGMEDRR